MKATGITLTCECKRGDINTYHDDFEKTIEQLIDNIKVNKDWVGGKFISAYLEFDNKGDYYKVYLDINELTKLIR